MYHVQEKDRVRLLLAVEVEEALLAGMQLPP
jgi:hypothetical protein